MLKESQALEVRDPLYALVTTFMSLKPPLSSTLDTEIDQFSLLKWLERSHKQTKLLF